MYWYNKRKYYIPLSIILQKDGRTKDWLPTASRHSLNLSDPNNLAQADPA